MLGDTRYLYSRDSSGIYSLVPAEKGVGAHECQSGVPFFTIPSTAEPSPSEETELEKAKISIRYPDCLHSSDVVVTLKPGDRLLPTGFRFRSSSEPHEIHCQFMMVGEWEKHGVYRPTPMTTRTDVLLIRKPVLHLIVEDLGLWHFAGAGLQDYPDIQGIAGWTRSGRHCLVLHVPEVFWALVNGFTTYDVPPSAFIAFSTAGIIYGGFHCVAWNAVFSSSTEQLIWRISFYTSSVMHQACLYFNFETVSWVTEFDSPMSGETKRGFSLVFSGNRALMSETTK
jgi:hypothetical protein